MTPRKDVEMDNWKNRVSIIRDDIAKLDCDVIVNAANESLAHGGGVCGAIHRAAGIDLARECGELGGCETGEAVMTEAYDLPCRKIIHTVGPVYSGVSREKENILLASCYLRSISLAAVCGYKSIAFPSISTGSYRYPFKEACRVALAAVKEGLADHPEIEQVILVCYSHEDLIEYEAAFREMA